MIIFIISKLINCWNRITILHFIILDLSAFPHFVECKIFYAYLLGRINQKFAVVRLQIEYFIAERSRVHSVYIDYFFLRRENVNDDIESVGSRERSRRFQRTHR